MRIMYKVYIYYRVQAIQNLESRLKPTSRLEKLANIKIMHGWKGNYGEGKEEGM